MYSEIHNKTYWWLIFVFNNVYFFVFFQFFQCFLGKANSRKPREKKIFYRLKMKYEVSIEITVNVQDALSTSRIQLWNILILKKYTSCVIVGLLLFLIVDPIMQFCRENAFRENIFKTEYEYWQYCIVWTRLTWPSIKSSTRKTFNFFNGWWFGRSFDRSMNWFTMNRLNLFPMHVCKVRN